MGFFSWMTSDTSRSITNVHSSAGAYPVYLLCPDGKKIKEAAYGGYGVFGAYDVYALLANWNVPEKCNGNTDHDRLIGIELGCDDNYPNNVRYTIKIVEDENLSFEEVGWSRSDPTQGFFSDENSLIP